MPLVINFVAFQVGWFSSVLGGAEGLPWLGPIAVLLIVAYHLYRAEQAQKELLLVVFCGLLGAVFDSVLVSLNWVGYPSGTFVDGIAPYWIIGMWMLFATTLNMSMRWLKNRYLIAAVLGLVAGPLSYVAGQKLGGIEFIDRPSALVALGIGWAVIMPALMYLSNRLDGYGPVKPDIHKESIA
jgi:hypothetical protein